MLGCRAIYHEGWKAVVYHPIQEDAPGLDVAQWELYDLGADPAECHDLAAAEPERCRSMVDLWWAEAERHGVLPLDNRPFSEFVFERPGAGEPARTRYVLWPGRAPVPESQAPPTRGVAHTITAHLEVREGEAVEGALAVQGSVLGGWSFHVRDGHLAYVHNLAGWREYRVEAPLPHLAPGPHRLEFRYTPGRGELLVDGAVIGEGPIKRFAWSRYSLTGHGLTVGYASGIPPADRDYVAPFPCTAALDHVEIVLLEPPVVDAEAEAAAVIASQ
jgi:arylsulfatase